MKHINQVLQEVTKRTDDMFKADERAARASAINARNRCMVRLNHLFGWEFSPMPQDNDRGRMV